METPRRADQLRRFGVNEPRTGPGSRTGFWCGITSCVWRKPELALLFAAVRIESASVNDIPTFLKVPRNGDLGSVASVDHRDGLLTEKTLRGQMSYRRTSCLA